MTDEINNITSPPSVLTTTPESAKKVHWSLFLVIAAVITILIAIAGFFLWLKLSQSVTPMPSISPSAVPLASGDVFFATPTPTVSPANVSPSPLPINLGVSISYVQSSQFVLNIDEITKTTLPANIDRFPVGSQFVYLRVFSSLGAVLSENRFTMPTALSVDTPNVPGGTYVLPSNKEMLIIPISTTEIPSKVAVVTASGQTMSEKSFDFASMPAIALQSEIIPTPSVVVSPQTSAQVQGARVLAGATGRTFDVVVVNDLNALGALSGVSSSAAAAVAIKPWTNYNVNVQSLPNTGIDLGCKPVNINGLFYPACNSVGYIESFVRGRGLHADAIIVATNTPYDAGSAVRAGDSILGVVAVGSSVSSGVIAHELGHGIGQMVDEYIGDIPGAQPGYSGPNCFESLNECQTTTEKFPEAQCTQRCNTPETFRPASDIMYNNYSKMDYGAYETCLLDKKIASLVGGTDSCPGDKTSPPPPPSPSPSPPAPPAGDYWGWHR